MLGLRKFGRLLRKAKARRPGKDVPARPQPAPARDIPLNALVLDAGVIREWIAGAKQRIAEDAPASVRDPMRMEAVLDDLTHDHVGKARNARIAELLIGIDYLWDPVATRTVPVNTVRLIGKRAGGATGKALVALADLAKQPGDVGAALILKALVTDNALVPLPRILALVLHALAAQPHEVQALANHLFHHGHRPLAADLCRQLIARGQTVRDTYLVLAMTERIAGEDPEPSLQLGLLHFPQDQVLLGEAAKMRLTRGDKAQAIEYALRAVRQTEKHPDLLAASLEVLISTERLDEALEQVGGDAYDRTTNLPLLIVIADAAARSQRFSTALRYGCQALALDPDNAAARYVVLVAAAHLWDRCDARDASIALWDERADTTARRGFVVARLGAIKRMPLATRRLALRDFVPLLLGSSKPVDRDLMLRFVETAILASLDEIAASLIRRIDDEQGLALHEAISVAKEIGLAGEGAATELRNVDAAATLFQEAANASSSGPAALAPRSLMLLAASIDPTGMTASLNAGLAELAAGRPAEAERQFRRIARRGPIEAGRLRWPLANAAGAWPRAPFPEASALFEDRLAQAPLPRITLITSSYNQGRFIEETILSILNQNYPNLEYIIVDAGSTDETPAIIERYRDRISDVFVYEGMRQTEALNFGFSKATGEILGWLNTDDLLLPGALHAVAATYVESGADLLMGDCLIFRGGHVEELVIAERGTRTLSEEGLLDIYHSWLSGGFICQPEVFMTRRALDKAGGRLDETLNYTMDYDLWLRLARARISRASIAWPIAGFRKHDNQKTADEYACFTELRSVRDRHAGKPDAPARTSPKEIGAALKRSPALALRLWDIPDQIPLRLASPGDRLMASPAGRTITVIGPGDAPEAGLVIDLFGLGGKLPGVAEVQRALDRSRSPSIAWIWDGASLFAGKRRLSEIFGLVVPADARVGAYLANLSESLPALAQGAIAARKGLPATRLPAGAPPCCLIAASDEIPGAVLRDRLGNASLDVITPGELAALSAGDALTHLDLLGRYEVVLIHSTAGEVPRLAFEALMAGTVPVVLSAASPEPGTRPLVETAIAHAPYRTAEDLHRIAEDALARAAREGEEGRASRHREALARHTLAARLDQLISIVQAGASKR